MNVLAAAALFDAPQDGAKQAVVYFVKATKALSKAVPVIAALAAFAVLLTAGTAWLIVRKRRQQQEERVRVAAQAYGVRIA